MCVRAWVRACVVPVCVRTYVRVCVCVCIITIILNINNLYFRLIVVITHIGIILSYRAYFMYYTLWPIRLHTNYLEFIRSIICLWFTVLLLWRVHMTMAIERRNKNVYLVSFRRTHLTKIYSLYQIDFHISKHFDSS